MKKLFLSVVGSFIFNLICYYSYIYFVSEAE